MVEGFLLGLSVGAFCLGWCLPAFLPYFLSEKRNPRENFKVLAEFLGGRFLGSLFLGALVGYLGERVQSSFFFNLSYLFIIALGLILIFYSLSNIRFSFRFCPKKRMPGLLGFLLGANICPPFLAAVFYAFSLKSISASVFFFILFFLGTSIYFIFPAFLGFLNFTSFFQKMARFACLLSGFFFIFFSLNNLLFSGSKIFSSCPFENFCFSLLKYPLEIPFLILGVFLGFWVFFKKRYFELRYLTLFLFFIVALFRFPQFCPFFVLQEISLGRVSSFLALLFFVFLLVLTLIFGRFFCGWLCPGLFFQEIIFRISQKIKFLPKIKPPKRLIYIKFFFLILILILVWIKKDTILCGRDPFGALFGFFRNPFSLIFLGLILIFSSFVYLPFCRFLCPLGALLSLFSRIAIFQLKIDPDKCKSCSLCQEICPTEAISGKGVDNGECIRCGECQRVCSSKSIKLTI